MQKLILFFTAISNDAKKFADGRVYENERRFVIEKNMHLLAEFVLKDLAKMSGKQILLASLMTKVFFGALKMDFYVRQKNFSGNKSLYLKEVVGIENSIQEFLVNLVEINTEATEKEGEKEKIKVFVQIKAFIQKNTPKSE